MIRWQHFRLTLLALLTFPGMAGAEIVPREHITIVGSSTAFPIVSTVAERFQRNTQKPSPVVISTGTGGGFKLFCSDKGLETPDITMASRKIKQSELELCRKNGINQVVELKIGYDGIAFASSSQSEKFKFRMKDLYLALAHEVADPEGRPKVVPNPYQRWKQINPELPDVPIRVLGPPPTSGTRDILVERLIDPICRQYDFLNALRDKDIEEYKRQCHTVREDGAYVNAGENDARVVRKLKADPTAIGILGYNFLDQNSGILQAATIEGVAAEFEIIESGNYPLSRPLYLYINKARSGLIDSLDDFLDELTSDSSWSDEGYLVDKGLIPLNLDEKEMWARKAQLGPGSCIAEC